jgi:1-pyrroline-5-carboxylate dehydrogenase
LLKNRISKKAIANALESRSAWASMLGTASCHFLESGRIDCRSIQSKNKRGNYDWSIKNVHQAEIDASCELIDFYVLM